MKVFVDTSALLAILGSQDRWHDEAIAIYHELGETADLVTTNYVAIESIQLVRRRLGVAATRDLLDRHLPIIATLWVDEATHRVAAGAYRPDGGPSIVDHVSFEVMRQQGLSIAFAFDRDFQNHGFTSASVTGNGPRHWLREAPAPYGTDMSDVVGVAEVARRAGRSVNTIQSWRRRHADFPRPVVTLGAGPIWNWAAVEEWIATRALSREISRV